MSRLLEMESARPGEAAGFHLMYWSDMVGQSEVSRKKHQEADIPIFLRYKSKLQFISSSAATILKDTVTPQSD